MSETVKEKEWNSEEKEWERQRANRESERVEEGKREGLNKVGV